MDRSSILRASTKHDAVVGLIQRPLFVARICYGWSVYAHGVLPRLLQAGEIYLARCAYVQMFTRVMLCVLRSVNEKNWSQRQESNPQPTDYKSVALPLSHAGITIIVPAYCTLTTPRRQDLRSTMTLDTKYIFLHFNEVGPESFRHETSSELWVVARLDGDGSIELGPCFLDEHLLPCLFG